LKRQQQAVENADSKKRSHPEDTPVDTLDMSHDDTNLSLEELE